MLATRYYLLLSTRDLKHKDTYYWAVINIKRNFSIKFD